MCTVGCVTANTCTHLFIPLWEAQVIAVVPGTGSELGKPELKGQLCHLLAT